jgi:hypothetical protein
MIKAQKHTAKSHAYAGARLDEVSLHEGRFQIRGLCDVHLFSRRKVVGFGTTISSARCAVSNWRDLFQAALLKANLPDLEQRVTAAQQAIDERMRELIQENIQASKEEREIRDAVQTLKMLRREIEENKRRTAG